MKPTPVAYSLRVNASPLKGAKPVARPSRFDGFLGLSRGVAALALGLASASAFAQPQGRGGAAPPAAANARAQAPYDLSGYWVSMVTDDWRYRMLTPPKGNADYMPVNAEARTMMDAWDPAKDEASGEACRGYGAGGIMRLPGRLHITWEDDNTMKMDIDTGTQTRRFVFGAPTPASEPSWQGSSTSRWMFPPGARGRGAEKPQTGQLVVTTTRMRPGYLRKNGVPYTCNGVGIFINGYDEFLRLTRRR